MPEDKKTFDPSMFKSLEEMRDAFPDEAKKFVQTEDGKGFVSRFAIGDADRAVDMAKKDVDARKQLGDFLKLCDELTHSNLPSSEKEKNIEFVSRLKEHNGQNLEKFFNNEYFISDPQQYIVAWLSRLPLPDDEYRRLCEITEEESQIIMGRIVDLGTEPGVMTHGTFVDMLENIKTSHGIIARIPRFAKRWKRFTEHKTAAWKDSGNCVQGSQSISTFDPHYEIELLEDITENRNHTIYSLFVWRDLIKEFPEHTVGFKNIKLDEDSEIYHLLYEYISKKYGCSTRISSIYHVDKDHLVVHGEFVFSPEQAKKLLVANRNSGNFDYSDPIDTTDIDQSLAVDLKTKAKPENIVDSLANNRWGNGLGKVNILIKPTQADIKSGKIIRNQGGLLGVTVSESDWESRIPLDRIIGVAFRKNMNLAKVVAFARDLSIPVYDTEGNVIWPREVKREDISNARVGAETHQMIQN